MRVGIGIFCGDCMRGFLGYEEGIEVSRHQVKSRRREDFTWFYRMNRIGDWGNIVVVVCFIEIMILTGVLLDSRLRGNDG